MQPIRVAVNVSARQFYHDDIVTSVREALRDADLKPEWLELEFTESLTLDDTELTLDRMRALKDLGVHLSIDDFGTGWSSLSFAQKTPQAYRHRPKHVSVIAR